MFPENGFLRRSKYNVRFMEKKIKLIWDFRGPDAQRMAEHHAIHLKDFIRTKKLNDFDITGVDQINKMHSLAYWVVPESEMITYRDILKPHRATLYP